MRNQRLRCKVVASKLGDSVFASGPNVNELQRLMPGLYTSLDFFQQPERLYDLNLYLFDG
jgi:hypothetical protein